MSRQANPMAIGAFVLGGLTLLVAGILLFGGREFFSPKVTYVVFFDSSLNGLIIGAPVSMQGVQIGTVKDIDILLDRDTSTVLKPVLIEVDVGTLHDLQGGRVERGFGADVRHEELQKLIDDGLRARLEMQSILTARLYVELNFFPAMPPHLVGHDYRGYLEIPSAPNRTDELRNTLDEMVRQFRRIPFDRIVGDLTETLSHIRELTASDDLKTTRRELAEATTAAHALLSKLDAKADPLADGVLGTTREMRALLQDFRGEVKPLVRNSQEALVAAREALRAAETTMVKMQGSLEAADAFTAPDSNLDAAIIELRRTSKAVRDLADYLARKPNAFIFGKD
ncbi:MAG: MlaD family protein [Methylotetracoccus sp.]